VKANEINVLEYQIWNCIWW